MFWWNVTTTLIIKTPTYYSADTIDATRRVECVKQCFKYRWVSVDLVWQPHGRAKINWNTYSENPSNIHTMSSASCPYSWQNVLDQGPFCDCAKPVRDDAKCIQSTQHIPRVIPVYLTPIMFNWLKTQGYMTYASVFEWWISNKLEQTGFEFHAEGIKLFAPHKCRKRED